MARDVLEVAEKLIRRRKFDLAIKLLYGRSDVYEGNFDYYLLNGVAYLYAGDYGNASAYFQKARKIKLTDTTLLLGQAALFLRRGEFARAVQYYLEILEYEPENKIAAEAMEFIRTKGNYTLVCKMVDTGDIEQFFPPLGVNPYKIAGIVMPVLACLLGVLLVFRLMPVSRPEAGKRADLSALVLSLSERKNLQETDLSSGSFAYILSSGQINDSYDKAQGYFQNYRDNLAQMEINRILNSNASLAVKQKANLLMGYLESPSFDTVKDVPAYQDVEKEPALYLDCWVNWSGRVSNVQQTENSFNCDFLVGYDTMQKVEGIVPLHFNVPPAIENEKPLTVLAKISSVGGKIALEGKSVYQSVKN